MLLTDQVVDFFQEVEIIACITSFKNYYPFYHIVYL